MKNNFLSGLIISLSVLVFFSCGDKKDYYSLGDIWISLGMIEKQDSDSNFIIYLDNGDTLVPATNDAPYFYLKNDQRVMVNYTILDEVGKSTKKFWVKINDLYDVLFKDIIELNEANNDSIGNDPVNIDNIWISKNLLNIEFKYLGGDKIHYINLTHQADNITNLSQSVELELRHNANNDSLKYSLTGIVTFNLKNIEISNQDSVNFIVKSTDYKGDEHTFNGTYYY